MYYRFRLPKLVCPLKVHLRVTSSHATLDGRHWSIDHRQINGRQQIREQWWECSMNPLYYQKPFTLHEWILPTYPFIVALLGQDPP